MSDPSWSIFWRAAAVTLTMIPLAAQPATHAHATHAPATSQAWTPSRTPDGHPDFQGVWVNNTVTPLVRPHALAGKEFLTDDELKVLEDRAARLFNGDGDTAPGEELFEALLANPGEYKSILPTGDVGQVWAGEPLVFEHRTSQVIDPRNGALPPLTPEGERRQAAGVEARRLHPADGPEDRNLLERCITHGAIKVGWVQARNNGYYQIVQTHDTVLLHTENMGEARIVRLDGRPHPPAAIRAWLGDARGRWEGDTLVIDTTNFHPRSTFRQNRTAVFDAEHFHLVERLTQLDAQTLEYRVTVDDPSTWTQPWTAVATWRRSTNRLYEFACHEANYAMEGMLRAVRSEEAAADARRPK